jgi:hypothetical protein
LTSQDFSNILLEAELLPREIGSLSDQLTDVSTKLTELYQKHTKAQTRLQEIESELENIRQRRIEKAGLEFKGFDDFFKESYEELVDESLDYFTQNSSPLLQETLKNRRSSTDLKVSIEILLEILRHSILRQDSEEKFNYRKPIKGMWMNSEGIWRNDRNLRVDAIESYIKCLDYICTRIIDRNNFSEQVKNNIENSRDNFKKEIQYKSR